MTAAHPQTEPSASPSSADLRLVLQSPEWVHCLSGDHLEWLTAALREDPRGTLEHVLTDVFEERAQLWAIQRGFEAQALVVTYIETYPHGDALAIQLCAGREMSEWLPLLEELEEHARALGCSFVEIHGRRGWERMLPDYAFRGIVLGKEL